VIGRSSRDAEREFTEFASVVTPRLFRSALLLCGDWQLAEDLVQTSLAKLYVAWGRVRKADSREAYAHGTLTKTFLSHKRVRRNASLDKADRAVVVLRYWEDRSVAETARQLGLSESAVRTRASRAMPKLRAALTPAEEATT